MKAIKEAEAAASSSTSRVFLPLAIFALSVVVMLLAEVTIAGWAEASETHHALQHVLIFLAGCGVGGSSLSLLQLRKRQML